LRWQTRWFSDASLGGWPWEQGRWSVYASMLLLVVTIIVGSEWKQIKKHIHDWRLGIFALFIVLTSVVTLSRVATGQWWIEVILLAACAWTLHAKRVDGRRIAMWFAISLIPHAALAIWQYVLGNVAEMKWLGIAAQSPESLGVAVVEHDDVRILRAYGGFPHPNILGGWMAVGLVVVLQLAAWAQTKWRALLWSLCAGLFGIVLPVAYSRSAWLAAALGVMSWLAVSVVVQKRRPDESFSTQFAVLALISAIALGGAVAFSQRAHILARTDATQRIEVKSVQTRSQSLMDGWKLFLAHPLVGTGPNAELAALSSACDAKCREPLVPPHNVFVLALVNVGLVGAVLLLSGLWLSRRRWKLASIPLFASLLPLLFFDHYLWSTWSGLCLLMIVMVLSQQTRMPEEHSRG